MKKILIIEDEDIMFSLLEKKLSQAGYEVVIAKDGEEGLNLAQEQEPNLILLDIMMPKKNGFEVLEALQKDAGLKQVPVIVISNSGQPVEIERVKSLGAKDWLIKTEFDPQEVIDKVKKQIGQ